MQNCVRSRKKGWFFEEVTVNNGEFTSEPTLEFGFDATHVMIFNDTEGEDELLFAVYPPEDEDDIQGKVTNCEHHQAFDGLSQGRIWLKHGNGAEVQSSFKARVYAWRRSA